MALRAIGTNYQIAQSSKFILTPEPSPHCSIPQTTPIYHSIPFSPRAQHFLASINTNEMNFFDNDHISPGFSTLWNHPPHRITRASFFNTDKLPAEIQNRVVVGVLLGLSFPKNSRAFGLRLSTSGPGAGANNRQRIFNSANYDMILIFADMYDLPNCFAVIFQQKRQFHSMFRNNPLTDQISIGDGVVFVEPQPHDERLGENMTVIKNPSQASLLVHANWPIQQPLVASEGNQQVAFHAVSKTIELTRITLLTGRTDIHCANKTCDRQDIKCTGCFGRSETNKPIVLQCDVTVHDCPLYERNTQTAVFWKFRSLRFSKIFFQSLDELSTKDDDTLETMHSIIRNRIPLLVQHINNAHGWTIIGWHRRGTVRQQNDEILIANKTKGHLVYLMPTDAADVSHAFFDTHRIPTPELNFDDNNNDNANNVNHNNDDDSV